MNLFFNFYSSWYFYYTFYFCDRENSQNKIKHIVFLSAGWLCVVLWPKVSPCHWSIANSPFKSTEAVKLQQSQLVLQQEPTMTVGGGGEGRNEEVGLLQSFTTLSTIAIQAGRSQITISVLKVGGLNQEVGFTASTRTITSIPWPPALENHQPVWNLI